jgi:hypothetical protein
MGWYFRRSLNLGPLRLNLSRRGVGWSVGGRGLRVGETAGKKRYTQASIPGTGVGYRSQRGCLLALVVPLLATAALVAAASLALGGRV